MGKNTSLQNVRNSVQSVLMTDHFEKWLEKQDKRILGKVQLRLNLIILNGHFGVINFFDGIIELKWKSGLRIYTSRLSAGLIVVLAGGTKNGQDKDIKKAKRLLKEIKEGDFASLCSFIS